jgi:nucleotide-binding universal stress UspA family protein
MTIVAAVKNNDHAKKVLGEADALARAFDDDLQIVHVVAYNDNDLDIGVASKESGERIRRIATEQVHEIVDGSVTEYQAVGLVGENVKSTLNHYLADQDVRYLVIGGRNRSRIGKALLGSTAQSILLSSKHAVVTVS